MLTKRIPSVLILSLLAGTFSWAQNTSDLAALRRDIDDIKSIQKDIQKNLQSLKDLLTGKQPPLENVYVDILGKPVLGNDRAPVIIVEFTDFQCPFCAAYAHDTFTHTANPASASTFPFAAPESIDTTPSAMPSRNVSAFPAATSAAAAFTSTISRRGPRSPASTALAISRFTCRSPPRKSSASAL
jgi:RNAse (barnase) inhibitor barstar